MSADTTVHVSDRTWEAMVPGAEFERWPGDTAPEEGQRVIVFDRDLDFTQHDVVRTQGMRVWVGPAIPWERP
jgi:hypothetical protein